MSSAPAAVVDLIQMDFEGVEAQDSDIASMSTLLNQLVKESGVDSGQLAKVLVSQNYVGSVLKVGRLLTTSQKVLNYNKMFI